MSKEFEKLLGDDLWAKAKEKLGDEKIYLGTEIDGKFVPKARFNEVNEKLDAANKQHETAVEKMKSEYDAVIKEMTDKVKELEPLAKEHVGIAEKLEQVQAESSKKIAELEEAREKEKETSAKLIAQERLDNKLNFAIKESGARNVKAVRANIDLEKISLDKDNLIGFKEQVDTLKQSDEWLFGEIRVDGEPPVSPDPQSKEFFTLDEIKRMSTDQIAENLDKVNASMKNN